MEKTYEEEIKEGISKASKKLRGIVKQIVELNSGLTSGKGQKEMDELYDSVSDREVIPFNSLLIAANGVIRKKDSFYLLYSQLYESFDNVVRELKFIRDLEDKAALLNELTQLDRGKAEAMFGKLTTEDGVMKLELAPNGTYRVASISFKTTMKRELNKFSKNMSEAKTLWILLEEYASKYNIADIIPDEINDVMEDIKTGFKIEPGLLDYYTRYIGGMSGLSCSISTKLLHDEDESEENTETSIFKKFDEATPIKAMLKLNLFNV